MPTNKSMTLDKAIRYMMVYHEVQANEALNASTTDMTDKRCPMNGMQKCTTDCVHFSPGKVVQVKGSLEDGPFGVVHPRCKLWCRSGK